MKPLIPLTRDLVRLITNRPVGQADLEAAALLVLDTMANIAAGPRAKPARPVLDWARENAVLAVLEGERPPADRGRLALLLGAMAHMLEMDDLHRASVVHPGCVVVPAAMAVTAGRADIDGRRFLAAVIRGYEAITRIGMGVGPAHYKLWHNTATCGPFGAAMTASLLLGLDEEHTLDAMGNAGTQSAGLWQFLASAAMSKHLHTGRAAEAGVVSAQLASHGFTGARDVLEGAQGFFAALAPEGRPLDLLAVPDAPWQIHRTSIKPWPSCRHTHPLADAAFAARAAMTDTEIREVRIHTYGAALAVCNHPQPETDYQAKFSLQHVAAAVLADGRLDLDSFDAAARARLAPLRRRVKVCCDSVIDRAYPQKWGCRLQLFPVTGKPVVINREQALGDPERPLATDALIAKARTLVVHGGMDEPERLIDGVLAMAAGAPPPPLSLLLSP